MSLTPSASIIAILALSLFLLFLHSPIIRFLFVTGMPEYHQEPCNIMASALSWCGYILAWPELLFALVALPLLWSGYLPERWAVALPVHCGWLFAITCGIVVADIVMLMFLQWVLCRYLYSSRR